MKPFQPVRRAIVRKCRQTLEGSPLAPSQRDTLDGRAATIKWIIAFLTPFSHQELLHP